MGQADSTHLDSIQHYVLNRPPFVWRDPERKKSSKLIHTSLSSNTTVKGERSVLLRGQGQDRQSSVLTGVSTRSKTGSIRNVERWASKVLVAQGGMGIQPPVQ